MEIQNQTNKAPIRPALVKDSIIFKSTKCECHVDTVHDEYGVETNTLGIRKAQANVELPLQYLPRKGLSLLADAKKDSPDLLLDFVFIECGDSKALADFFSNYGFLFPVPEWKFARFDLQQIWALQKRLKYTLDLVAELQYHKKLQDAGEDLKQSLDTTEEIIHYSRVYQDVCQLLFSEPVTLTNPKSGKDIYRSCNHAFTELLNSPELPAWHEPVPFPVIDDSDKPEWTEKVKDPVRSPRFLLSNKDKRDAYDLVEMQDIDDPVRLLINPARLFDIFRRMDMFDRPLSPEQQEIVAFFYHAENELGHICLERGRDDFGFTKDLESAISIEAQMKKEKVKKYFDADMKRALIHVAVYVLKEEIDHNLHDVNLSYNAEAHSLKWDISNFLTALYYSIFYNQPGAERFRRCKNPECKRHPIFRLSNSDSRSVYCSRACQSVISQRELREKKKHSD